MKYFHPELKRDIYLMEKSELTAPVQVLDDLSDYEVEILLGAKVANPFWFRVVLLMASIMIERRYKHSGTKHAMFNFYDMAERSNLKLQTMGRESNVDAVTAAVLLESLKESRTAGSGSQEFSDESPLDTAVDGLNYGILKTVLRFFVFDKNTVLGIDK